MAGFGVYKEVTVPQFRRFSFPVSVRLMPVDISVAQIGDLRGQAEVQMSINDFDGLQKALEADSKSCRRIGWA